jgi:hypothetical protein
MLKFIQFKKEKQLYTNHYQFSKSGSDGPKPTVMITITLGFILKTDNNNEIKKIKVMAILGFKRWSQGP